MSLDSFALNRKMSLLLILGVSIGIKIVLVLMSDSINPDAVRYVNSAHDLMQGEVYLAFTHEKMLGFTLLLGLAQVVVSDWFLAGKLLAALPLVLTTIPLYLMTRDLFGARPALATGLMFSVIPFLNELVTEIVKGPLFLLCVISSLWLVLRGIERQRWQDMFAGGLLGLLALLFRVEGLVYLATVTVLLVFQVCCDSRSRGPCLRLFGAFSAPLVIVWLLGGGAILSGVIPAELLTRIQSQFSYYFSPNLLDNARAIYQYLKIAEPQFSGGQWSNDFFELARYQLPLIYLVGLVQVFAKSMFPALVLPFAFGWIRIDRGNRSLILLLGVILGFVVMNYLFLVKNNFLSSRYTLIPVVLSLVLAGRGLDRLLHTLSFYGFAKIASVVVLVLCFLAPAAKSFSVLTKEDKLLKTAGEWLAENRNLGQTSLITNSEQVVFYAGLLRRDYQVFSAMDPSGYEEAARHEGSALVVLELSAARLPPPLDVRHFKLLKEFSGKGDKILIYERLK